MRILLCGGGTAGHVYPSIAVAETIIKNMPEAKIAYVVTENGIENRLVNYKKYYVEACSIKKTLTKENFKNVIGVIKAIKESKNIIKEFRPDIIFGTGGYASFPVLYAGQKLGVKTIMHESNFYPGKVIRYLSKKADYVLLNFEESKQFFNKKVNSVYTGNPVRTGLTNANKGRARQQLNITQKNVVLIFGGSLGAQRINEIAIDLIENYIRYDKDILLVCCTGKKYFKQIKSLLKDKRLDHLENVLIKDYIDNLPEYMVAADVVICRSGAMTISELAVAGKCAIFVPSPNVTDNHQYKNAKILSDSNAGILVKEDEKYLIPEIVREMIEKPENRKIYENNIKKFHKNDSNKLIFQLFNKITNKK